MSSSSRARLQTIIGAVGTCLVILPGCWPPPTAEGRGAQATCQPPPGKSPRLSPAPASARHVPVGTGEVAERGRLAETQQRASPCTTQRSPCAGGKEPQPPQGPVRTDAGYHGPEHQCSPAPLQRHRLRGAGGLTTGVGDMPSLHCPQPSPAKQTASQGGQCPGSRREGPCGACQGTRPPRWYKSLGCKI